MCFCLEATRESVRQELQQQQQWPVGGTRSSLQIRGLEVWNSTKPGVDKWPGPGLSRSGNSAGSGPFCFFYLLSLLDVLLLCRVSTRSPDGCEHWSPSNASLFQEICTSSYSFSPPLSPPCFHLLLLLIFVRLFVCFCLRSIKLDLLYI